MKAILNLVAALVMIAIFGLVFTIVWKLTTIDAIGVLTISGFLSLMFGVPLFMWVDEKSRKRKRRC